MVLQELLNFYRWREPIQKLDRRAGIALRWLINRADVKSAPFEGVKKCQFFRECCYI